MSMKKYNQTVGRRKSAIARIALKAGNGKFLINGREVEKYFTVPRMLTWALEGLTVSGNREKFDVVATVTGGGINGQAGAVRLAIARALLKENASIRPELKKLGMFTRDPRMVERKKYGFRKARRGTQFSKR